MAKNLLDAVKVETPCGESWNEMQGNAEVRFCSHCAKNVHNMSAMTRREARRLVARSNGNLCVRYAKLPDGKVLTADRPLHQIGKRATQFAAGVFGATLALSAATYAQGEPLPPLKANAAVTKSQKEKSDAPTASISGTVTDAAGAVIPNAALILRDNGKREIQRANSNSDGDYEFKNLPIGVYEIDAESLGFKKLEMTGIEIRQDLQLTMNLSLEVAETTSGILMILPAPEVELLYAASTENHIETRKLIAGGANVNEKDATAHNQTALHVAAETGNLEIVKTLLKSGADVNAADDDGDTALMIAAQFGFYEIVRALLDAGANAHLKNKNGKSAFDLAANDKIRMILQQRRTL